MSPVRARLPPTSCRAWPKGRAWPKRGRGLRVTPLALAVLLAGALAAAPAAACRCASRPLENYFEQAEIVLIGRVLSVTPGRTEQGVGYLAIEARPQLPNANPLKGDLTGLTLVTSDSSASCGVDVRAGELYVLFASRTAPGDALAWFDTCSGSRLYAGGPRAAETEPYPGLAVNLIVPRLVELAGLAPPPPPPTPGLSFHTSPACWTEPRVFHAGRPDATARARVGFSRRRVPAPSGEAILSPNGAYRLWARNPDTARPGPWHAAVLVDVERTELLWIDLDQVSGPVEPRWINEKILFLRVPWGRAAWSDLLVDVESGTLVYEEAALDGGAAFAQFGEACAGQCPCLPVPGSVETRTPPPVPRPRPGEAADLDSLVRSLAFLNRHWDGRVFTEPGGGVSVRSALARAGVAGERGSGIAGAAPEPPGDARAEYAVDVLEVRQTAGGYWLLVDLYATSPCQDPHAAVVHRGWVPAFADDGTRVADTYPGGC